MAFSSPEAVVRRQLVTDVAVSQVVGSRVYPVLAPSDAAVPFITWRRVGVSRQHSLAGPTGLVTVSVSFDMYAETYEAVRELADACRKALDGWGGTYENTVVANVSLDNESDGFAQLVGGDLPPVYVVTQTYGILWQET